MTTVISVPAAYVLARNKFRGKQTILFSLLFTQMIAGIVLLPSLYMIFQKISMSNSIFGVILVMSGVNLALVVWILFGYFRTLPVGIEEAARIDGCNYMRLLINIILPLSGPGIAVGAIFVFINTYKRIRDSAVFIDRPDPVSAYLIAVQHADGRDHTLGGRCGGVTHRDHPAHVDLYHIPEIYHQGPYDRGGKELTAAARRPSGLKQEKRAGE